MSVSQARATPSKPVHDGLWSPGRRSLTVGLVLTITLVAFEALAVSTVMPIVARELNGIELYGWVFTAFMLGSLIGIVLVGGLIDRRGLGGPFAAGIALFGIGLIVGGLARRCRSSSPLDSSRASAPGPCRRSRTWPSAAACRSISARRCSRPLDRLGPAGRPRPALAGIVGETIGWRWVFLGLLPLIIVSASIAFPAVRKVGPDPSDVANAATLRQRAPLAILVARSAPVCCSRA